MTSAASNYHESTSFIHQRYEDTALIVFQQQQKVRQDEKRREKQQHQQQQSKPFRHPALVLPLPADQHPEFSRYGNRAVVATETLTPTKPEVVKPIKTPEQKNTQPAVKSSSDSVDGVKPKRRNSSRSSRKSQTVVCLETTV